jgi:hypothetical protein
MRCPLAFAILDTATTNKVFLFFVEVNVLIDNIQLMICLDRSGLSDTFV